MFLSTIVHQEFGQPNEQQRRVNHLQNNDLYGEIDSIQTSLKPLFTLKQLWYVFQLSSLAFSGHYHASVTIVTFLSTTRE